MDKRRRSSSLIVALAAVFALLLAPAVCAAAAVPSSGCDQESHAPRGGKHPAAPSAFVCVFSCAVLASPQTQASTPAIFATTIQFERLQGRWEGAVAAPEVPPPRG